MALALVITNAGRAAIVTAANDGTNAVRIDKVGITATAIVASATTSALPGELKRIATLSGGVVADDTIHVVVRDESATAYTIRSIALYLADGTLFASYGQADPIVQKTAASLMLLALDVKFEDIAAASITFGDANFLNPPATMTTMGVVELATAAEAKAGTDSARAVTPAAAKGAVTDWLGFTPVNRAGDELTGDLKSNVSARPFVVRIGANASAGISYQLGGKAGYDIVADATGNLFFNRSNIATGGFVGTTLALPATGGVAVSGSLTRNNFPVWDAGNDGAGSGLDADLVRGQVAMPKAGGGFDGAVNSLTFGGVRNAFDDLAVLAMQDDRSAVLYTRLASGGPLTPVWRVLAGQQAVNFTAPISRGGATVWDAGNDGAGSGLDADLVRGQPVVPKSGGNFTGYIGVDTGNGVAQLNTDGSFTSTLSTAGSGRYFLGNTGLRYLFADSGSYHLPGAPLFSNGALVWTSGNDGAGSGLDADLLDGLQGSAYVKRSGDILTGSLAAPELVAYGGDLRLTRTDQEYGFVLRPNVAGKKRLAFATEGGGQLEIANFLTTFLLRNGNAVWDAGNDGAGSGLDADLLDGRHGADFLLRSDVESSVGGNGWFKLPGGLIFQWGGVGNPNGPKVHANFPIPFPNACVSIQATNGLGSETPPTSWPGVRIVDRFSFDVISAVSAGNPSTGFGVTWFAIGF